MTKASDKSPPLTCELLVQAYANGYFPMADNETGEISWYQPDPRAIIPLEHFHVSRSLNKTLRQKSFEVTFDKDFEGVMRACANRDETWISEEFVRVYTELHEKGFAHSVEVWSEGTLVGGTYGVTIRGAFFAESKFHKKTDASKVALYHLVERLKKSGFVLLEVQFLTPHLERLGAVEISGDEYETLLEMAFVLEVTF